MVALAVSLFIFMQSVYAIIISIFGYKNPKPYAQHPPENRFLVLIPACNEEKVISGIVKNIEHVDYPKELLDIFVIADNCTDRTGEIAEACGANVIWTNSAPGEPRGKPHAIRKTLEQLPDYHKLHDLLVIFDADNLVSRNFFTEINSQYIDTGRPEVIQAYLDCKNTRGVLPYAYYMNYIITNRFFQAARYNVNLNAAIGGTGFAVSTQYLWENGGWLHSCLTEDFEFQVRTTINGKRILWNHHARIYDEKPIAAKASYRQRVRWAQGHWYVAFHNTYDILDAVFRKTVKPVEALTTLLYMYSMSKPFQVLSTLAIILFLVASGGTHAIMSNIWAITFNINVFSILRFVYHYLVLFPISAWKDQGRIVWVRELLWALYSQMLLIPIGIISQFVGFLRFRRQNMWDKTEHTINVP